MESVPGFPSLCPFSRTAPSLPISLDPAGTQVRIMLEQSDVNIISSLPISLDPAGTQVRIVLEQPDVDIIDVLSGRSAEYRIQR
jgi:hypothetical protein